MAPPPPRRLCACSSRCIPAAAQRTTWMPWQWWICAQNLIRSGFGGIEKLRFPLPAGPCEQPGAQSSCRTSSSISWLPKDRQSFTRAVSRAHELLLRVSCTNCAICYELRIRAEYIRNKSTCGVVGCGRIYIGAFTCRTHFIRRALDRSKSELFPEFFPICKKK